MIDLQRPVEDFTAYVPRSVCERVIENFKWLSASADEEILLNYTEYNYATERRLLDLIFIFPFSLYKYVVSFRKYYDLKSGSLFQSAVYSGGKQIFIHHEVVYLEKSREPKTCILIQYFYFL